MKMHLPTMSSSLTALNATTGSPCPDLSEGTVLVSGWAQLAVCIIIVALCCCCTLLCLCTRSVEMIGRHSLLEKAYNCVCCTSSIDPMPMTSVQPQTVCSMVISDKPPSYEEAQRQSHSELPSYQEALRRSSQPSSEVSPLTLPLYLDS